MDYIFGKILHAHSVVIFSKSNVKCLKELDSYEVYMIYIMDIACLAI